MFQVNTTQTEAYSDCISTATAKAWLKVGNDDDALIGVLRDAAVHFAEDFTNRRYRTSAFVITAPTWDDLRRLPVGALTGAVTLSYYKEKAGSPSVVSTDDFTTNLLGDVLHVAYRSSMPTADPYRYDAVALTCLGGTAAADMPDAVKTACLMLVGHWFENRTAVQIGANVQDMPIAVDALLAQYRLE